MAEQITRQFVFDNYKAITSLLIDIQKSMFDSEEVFATIEDKRSYYAMHDAVNMPLSNIHHQYRVVSFEHDDINTFSAALAEKLTNLLIKLDVTNLIVVGETKRRFVGNPNIKFKPFQDAVRKFREISQHPQYDEAFKIDLSDLPDFIEMMFWIGRSDASAPVFIYFADVNEKIAFNLCQYGGIHIVEFGQENNCAALIDSLDMYFVDGRCVEKFSADGKIKGRVSKA